MIPLLYIPFCVFFAWVNNQWILHGKRIRHGLNGSLHVLVAFTVAYFTKWYHFFTVLLITRVAFDWSLNLFRGLPLDYLPLKPKSIADRVEKAVFNNGFIPKIIYILLIIMLIWS